MRLLFVFNFTLLFLIVKSQPPFYDLVCISSKNSETILRKKGRYSYSILLGYFIFLKNLIL